MFFLFNDWDGIDTSTITAVYQDNEVTAARYYIKCIPEYRAQYDSIEERDKKFDELVKILQREKGGSNVMDQIKQYIEKHRDLFLTIGVVLLLDHFVFNGAFREKLKSIVDSFLEKKTKELK